MSGDRKRGGRKIDIGQKNEDNRMDQEPTTKMKRGFFNKRSNHINTAKLELEGSIDCSYWTWKPTVSLEIKSINPFPSSPSLPP